eukprot:EG_transcript_15441
MLGLRMGETEVSATASAPPLPSALVLPVLPAPAAGSTRSCLPRILYTVPEFNPEPPVTGLECSCNNRRCCSKVGADGWVSMVAKEGFTTGHQQFTVHLINAATHLSVGVATANAPRTGNPYYHGLFLNVFNGYIVSLNNFQQGWTTGPLPAGSHVTMHVDFTAGTASYTVDGRDLGNAPCPLPPGPLYPAVLFYRGGQEVEFVP